MIWNMILIPGVTAILRGVYDLEGDHDLESTSDLGR